VQQLLLPVAAWRWVQALIVYSKGQPHVYTCCTRLRARLSSKYCRPEVAASRLL
jgi:hypothetical protein